MTLPTELRRLPNTRSRFRMSIAPVVATVAALALAGCGSIGGMFGSSTQQGGTTQFPCPAVGVLQGADHITLVRGAGTDLTDVMAKAEFGRVVSQCEYNTSDSTITVDIAFEGVAEIGPAATSRDLVLDTFVAVTRRFDVFDKKQIYQVPVTFEPGMNRMRFVQNIDGTVIPYGGQADGRIYQILIGFQLTAQQLEYNRTVPYTPIR
jgi:hypothetical protein